MKLFYSLFHKSFAFRSHTENFPLWQPVDGATNLFFSCLKIAAVLSLEEANSYYFMPSLRGGGECEKLSYLLNDHSILTYGLLSLEDRSANKKKPLYKLCLKSNYDRQLMNKIIGEVGKAVEIILSCAPILPDTHN